MLDNVNKEVCQKGDKMVSGSVKKMLKQCNRTVEVEWQVQHGPSTSTKHAFKSDILKDKIK